MALTVKALNNDTTFLLTFSPSITPSNVKSPERIPGSFTILTDPWLSGPATFFSTMIASQEHTTSAYIDSLADLPEPDIIVVSQDNPDHCHEETLCQLSPHVRSMILGAERVAKKIKSWQHFDLSCIHSLKQYDPGDPNSVFRLSIPPFSPTGAPGEITICLLEPKWDISGLHAAIGITYRPPASVLSLKPNSSVQLPQTPPASAGASPSPSPTALPQLPVSPLLTHPMTSPTKPSPPLDDSSPPLPEQPNHEKRPHTPKIEHLSGRANTIVLSPAPFAKQTERTVSVLYTPHGVDHKIVEPWAQGHLLEKAALPLAVLMHGFDEVGGPWWAGGQYNNGASSLPPP